ncbi:hypothetical protein sce5017 [Sorangium cellulosum So ce56]|uniref:DUF4276 family protein n=1 Tax=Sorangium cellulosum (strain So ce56) TaxID=448385 RepID=A9FL55_SORC5|nr:hypothetical protein [Sorangium cellulosum]CAN95180.1 hypothetical protein sce5017 [Sorangium cellulosum So ce56]
MRLLVFCEADADFRTVSALVDRVLQEEGPVWVRDLMPSHPESIRAWVGDGQGRSFFDLHNIAAYRRYLPNVRFMPGHFDGKPGAAGAQMARNAFTIARAVARDEEKKRDPPAGVAAVFVVWDMDDQGEGRRHGLAQARDEASRWARFRIVLGCPDAAREAWVLAGFEAETDEERARLDEVRRELGFCPCQEAHRLRAKEEHVARSPKLVVRRLTGDDFEREARCSTDAPLARLRGRGVGSGLHAFLQEVKERVVPLWGGSPSRT